MQITSVNCLILVVSIFFTNTATACGVSEFENVNSTIQLAKDELTIQKALATCGVGKGTFYHEVNKRVKHLYINGDDSVVDKYKVATLVSLSRLFEQQKYLTEVRNRFAKTEHGAIEYCIWTHFSTNNGCTHEQLLPYVKRDLPHAVWAAANFTSDNTSRISFLKKAALLGHVDAQVELILAKMGDSEQNDNEMKPLLLEIVDRGDSIDAELFLLFAWYTGYGPFNEDPQKMLFFAKKFLEYRDLPELYYYLALGYLETGDDELFYSNMVISAEKGYDKAKSALELMNSD
ncbi:hypothetical protein [Shewanella maritima]|uniref:hypothetical protein n=1 Tax=Shewanella maritima TaxID=2520507 RepID=UPI003735304D